ncbi:unnamed protein product [Gadus morhua 'NCC']
MISSLRTAGGAPARERGDEDWSSSPKPPPPARNRPDLHMFTEWFRVRLRLSPPALNIRWSPSVQFQSDLHAAPRASGAEGGRSGGAGARSIYQNRPHPSGLGEKPAFLVSAFTSALALSATFAPIPVRPISCQVPERDTLPLALLKQHHRPLNTANVNCDSAPHKIFPPFGRIRCCDLTVGRSAKLS